MFPDGQQIVLDEDEFAALDLPHREKKTVLAALAKVQEYFTEKLGRTITHPDKTHGYQGISIPRFIITGSIP